MTFPVNSCDSLYWSDSRANFSTACFSTDCAYDTLQLLAYIALSCCWLVFHIVCKFNIILLFTLAFPCYDGAYLPKQENEFINQVLDELETYQKRCSQSVLLFPTLPSRLRYLIHRTIEDLPELTTFSVGESSCRQVVVCPSEFRDEVQEDSDIECNSTLDVEALRSTKSKSKSRIRAPRRPDKALYTPRAARQNQKKQDSEASSDIQDPTTSTSITTQLNCSSCVVMSPLVLSKESLPITGDGALVHETTMEREENLSLSIHKEDITLCRLSEMSLEDDTAENEGLTCDLMEEIKKHLKETVTFTVQHVVEDYSTYENVVISLEDYGHVIEIYDFPVIFKTDDLLDAFTEYSDTGMKITWVDDTHALGIFATQAAATHALSICHPRMKARSLTEGSKKAKAKAVSRAEFIQPVKERPRTDSAVAKRMVTRALGLNGRGRGQLLRGKVLANTSQPIPKSTK
ncbi:R3H and coiled-coil domain-containing protein 1 [Stigmatopora nigra]